MSPYYYQAKKKKKGIQQGISIGILFLSAIILLICFLRPSLTGRFGESIHRTLMSFAGFSAVLIPVYLSWLAWRLMTKERRSGIGIKTVFFFLVFISITAFFSFFHTALQQKPGGLGGVIGDQVSIFLLEQFGVFFGVAITLLTLFFAGAYWMDIPPLLLLLSLKEKIIQDYAEWKSERQKLSARTELQKKLEGLPAAQKEISRKSDRPSLFLNQSPPIGFEKKQIEKKPSEGFNEKKLPLDEKKDSDKKSMIQSGMKKKNMETAASKTPPENLYAQYLLPELTLLEVPDQMIGAINKEALYANGTLLEQTLEQFHVKAKVIDIHPGPVITRYDLTPAPGVRVQSIETLANDIALAMKAQSLRVIAPIPGKAAVGIEISNPDPAIVYLREVLTTAQFQESSQILPLAIGKTTEGETFLYDMVTMPHLLIAGATGSGKSVFIHSLIISLLFRHKPDYVKLLLIDPKRLELPIYNGIPHLYNPACAPEDVRVLTEPKEVVAVLKKLISVMEQRYKIFAEANVRNIESYNEKMLRENCSPTPYIVVVIDELADLMVTVGREIEESIQRLAQMARAVGIHLALATQRPSVDVITGVIKANLPSRIAFQVLSKIDSRVILDTQGAEDLLGKGDALFLATGAPRPVRLQGAFVSESDVNRIVKFIKDQNFAPAYDSLPEGREEESIVESEDNQKLILRAARVVREYEKVSGDLLRADSEIGSKYDLAMTLLRKKGIIEKPKDTNRWKIHFDRLAEFLAEADKD